MFDRGKLSPSLFAILLAACYMASDTGAQSRMNIRGQAKPTILIEAERLVQSARKSDGVLQVQNMRPFGAGWSANQQLFWNPRGAGSRLELKIPIARDGRYALSAYFTKAVDYGVLQIGMQGKQLGRYDGFSLGPVARSQAINLGTHDLKRGDHWLIFVVAAKNPRSRGNMVGIDAISITTLSAVGQPGETEGGEGPDRPGRGDGRPGEREPHRPPRTLHAAIINLDRDMDSLSTGLGWKNYFLTSRLISFAQAPAAQWNRQQMDLAKRSLQRTDALQRDPQRQSFLARDSVRYFRRFLRKSVSVAEANRPEDVSPPAIVDSEPDGDASGREFKPPIFNGKLQYAGVVVPAWDRQVQSDAGPVQFMPYFPPPVLKIWNGKTGEFEFYGNEAFASFDQTDLNWHFEWQQPPKGTQKAIWQIANHPFASSLKNWSQPHGLLKTGELVDLPKPNTVRWFDVDFGPLVDRSKIPQNQRVLSSSQTNKQGQRLNQDLIQGTGNRRPSRDSQTARFQVNPILLRLAQADSQLVQTLYGRVICLDAQGKQVGAASDFVRFNFGPAGISDIPIFDPDDIDIPVKTDEAAPVVKLLEYQPIQFQAEDAHLRYVVTRDMPLLNYKAGHKLKFKPKKDKDLLEKLGDALSDIVDFFEDAVNWVSQAYDDIKSAAVDFVADDILDCGDPCRVVLAAGLDYGLTAVGVPPDLPNFDELVEMGKGNLAEMIAAEASSAGVPMTSELAHKMMDEVIRQAEQIGKHGKNGQQWLRPDPDFQYRPAYMKISVHNPPQAGLRDAGLSLYTWRVYKTEYQPIPNLQPGETRELTVFLRADYDYWETEYIRENKGVIKDSYWVRIRGWHQKYNEGEMEVAVKAVALPAGEFPVLKIPPPSGSIGSWSLKFRPNIPFRSE